MQERIRTIDGGNQGWCGGSENCQRSALKVLSTTEPSLFNIDSSDKTKGDLVIGVAL
jgi:hypothetical protein